MDTALSDSQELLRETTRRVLEDHCPLPRVRELISDPIGFDHETWARGAELGWYASLVPEDYGGGSVSGSGLLDAAVVAEELGRMVHPGPFQATNVVALAISERGNDVQRAARLPSIAGGDSIASWAFAEGDGAWGAEAVHLAVTESRGDYRLDGVKTCVQDAQSADLLLVTGRAPDGLSQFLVPTDTPGLSIEPLESLDLARRFADVRFTDVRVPAESLLGDPGAAAGAVERQMQVALVLQCAETNGAAAEALALTVQYCKDRVAFGRPIGSYQALKHRMADHRMWMEGSFAAASYAAAAVQARRPDAAVAARVAKAHVGKWSTFTLHDCIQLHGGIAMTWDYDLHLYFRRAISNEVIYGSPVEHCRSLVDIAEGKGPGL
jgi:alkylation response protein AidB-like acyl-CoA dehydrogenase